MTTGSARLIAALLGVALLGVPPVVRAAQPVPLPAAEEDVAGRTPPRLSWVEGEASFFRPGAEDWAPAQVNTPLAGGDELYTGHRGNLEIQTGAGEFVRAWGDTQLGLVHAEPTRLHVKVTAGHVALDLREVPAQRSLEVGTPHAAFVISAPGYYRVDVGPERTSLAIRRGGRASLMTAGGVSVALGAEEQVVVDARGAQRLAVPARDVWDTWNESRTAQLVMSTSARHVPAGVYGAADLDRHGDWRQAAGYGAVWVPRGRPAGWAPYSTGRWIADPYYGWTWVDAAPWGWAPYHYGRWVHVGGVWGWAPGPVVVRPVYAPALVAFFGTPAVSVTVGPPCVSWVALGWGEPLVPWWGSARFAGRPWWGGWGGPRVVNNVVVHRTRVVDVNEIHLYRNARVRHAVVAVREDGFGRRAVHEARVRDLDVRRLEPVRGRLAVRPVADSFAGDGRRGTRPPERTVTREVVSTRPVALRPDGRDRDRRDGDRDGGRAGVPPAASPAPPAVQPGRPVARPERPRLPVQAERPPVQAERPAPRPERPVAQPERPAVQPERPAAQPERPIARPERPPFRGERPVVRPDRPVAQPDRPSVRPERPTAPAGREVQPSRPVARPDRPAAVRPAAQPERPSGRAERPAVRVERPAPPQPRPDHPDGRR